MKCPCCARSVIVRRVSGGTPTCAPNGIHTDVLSARCPYPHCARLVFALVRPDNALRELVDAHALRRWLTRSMAFDVLRTAPLVAFVALFAFGPLGAVRAALEWRSAASDCALVLLGAVIAVLPAAILLLTILVGLVCDARCTRARFNEVFSGRGGGMCLMPEPMTYRS